MNIINSDLRKFCDFLMCVDADGKNSRMRMRFIKLANERLIEIEDERIRLVNKYSVKDTNDNPIVTMQENGTQTVELANPQEFQRDFSEILLEEFVVSENDERKPMLDAIKDMVLEAKGPFKGDEAFAYERWCQIVEGISS